MSTEPSPWWEQDLDALAAGYEQAELDAEVADRTRRVRSMLSLADRIRGAEQVRLGLAGGWSAVGRVDDCGIDWVVLREAARELLVVTGSVATAEGLGRAVPDELLGEVARRRSLSAVLRGWARDRSGVVVRLRDGTELHGALAGAYADHLELTGPRGTAAVAFGALASVVRTC